MNIQKQESSIMKVVKVFSCLIAGWFSVGQAGAGILQINCDNDFALFAGTANSVTRLVYQSTGSWDHQATYETSASVTVQGAEDTFYLLGMGAGGGSDNIGGKINGVNITTLQNITMSSNLSGYLTNYSTSSASIADGSYSASLSDVQSALPNLTWGQPTIGYSGAVASIWGSQFNIPPGQAALFKFTSASVGIPEIDPAGLGSVAALVTGALGLIERRRLKAMAA